MKASDINIPESLKSLDKDYEGLVIVSDIDKTYLSTEIESVWGLVKTFFENPERKNNVAGFSILLRALRRGSLEQSAKNPLFFISASPPQMHERIENKMALDGIEHEGIIFKDQLQNITSGHFAKLREQIGYKLKALLSLWHALPKKSKLVLCGDDSESDAVIYALFDELLNKCYSEEILQRLLEQLGVLPDNIAEILDLYRHLQEPSNAVQMVFINLITGSRPQFYSRFGSKFYPSYNSLQTACVLYQNNLIRLQAVESIAKDLIFNHDHYPPWLKEGLINATKRGLFSGQIMQEVGEAFVKKGLFPKLPLLEENQGLTSSLKNAKPFTFFKDPSDFSFLLEKYKSV